MEVQEGLRQLTLADHQKKLDDARAFLEKLDKKPQAMSRSAMPMASVNNQINPLVEENKQAAAPANLYDTQRSGGLAANAPAYAQETVSPEQPQIILVVTNDGKGKESEMQSADVKLAAQS